MSPRLLFALALLLPLALRAEDIQGIVLPFISVSHSSPVLQEVIESVLVEEGDTVKQNQILFKLRSAKEELAVQEAERLVQNAQFTAAGSTALAKDGMASRELTLKAQTELELARIRLALAQEQLKEKTVRSKINGIVVKKYKEAGESVDRVEKLADVVDIDQLKAQFYISPKYMKSLQLKQPITVRIPDLDNISVQGEISLLVPQVEATSGLFRVQVLLQNPDHKIKAGLKAIADFSKKE